MAANLHISATAFLHESRVLRETSSIIKHGIADKVFIVALHEKPLASHEIIDDFRRLWRVPLKMRSLGRQLPFQMLKYLELCLQVSCFAIGKSIRIVNVHSLSLLPLGVLLKYVLKAKLVYDTHELETESNGLIGTRKLLAKRLEKALIRHADLVLVVGNRIRDCYQKAYGHPSIVTVLNCPEAKRVEKQDLLRRKFSIPGSSRLFLYQGVLSPGRGLEQLINAFRSMKTTDNAAVIMGYGELAPWVMEVADRSANIFFHPAVPPDQLIDYTTSADVGVALIENTCLSYYYCLPNKVFEYLTAKLPVMVSDLPELAHLVTSEGIGVVARGGLPEDIISAIEKLNSMHKSDLAMRLKRASKKYSWPTQEKIMVAAYKEYVTHGSIAE
jgi:glycosyltransferase involved in cell wall biosynthesis